MPGPLTNHANVAPDSNGAAVLPSPWGVRVRDKLVIISFCPRAASRHVGIRRSNDSRLGQGERQTDSRSLPTAKNWYKTSTFLVQKGGGRCTTFGRGAAADTSRRSPTKAGP